MVKWNILEVFDFLKSHLISESKTENEKSIFNIKDAAKYCFDKFKNNSFEKTEISLEELDKLGIKNSKYPLEISFVDKESLERYQSAAGWFTFDNKSQRFVIKLNEVMSTIGICKDRNSDNFYQYWFLIFFHEFTHFCQFKEIGNIYNFNIINLLSAIDEQTYEEDKSLYKNLKHFFYFLEDIEIYARNNTFKNSDKEKTDYFRKLKFLEEKQKQITEYLQNSFKLKKSWSPFEFKKFKKSGMDSEGELKIYSLIFLLFFASLTAPRKLWKKSENPKMDFNSVGVYNCSFIDNEITHTKDFKVFKKKFFDFYEKEDLANAINSIKEFIDTEEKFRFLLKNIIKNFDLFYKEQIRKIEKAYNFNIRRDHVNKRKKENRQKDIDYFFTVNGAFLSTNKPMPVKDNNDKQSYKELYDFMNSNMNIESNIKKFSEQFNQIYLQGGRNIKNNFRENVDLSVVASSYDTKTGKSLNSNFADGLDLDFSTVSGNSAGYLVQNFEFANISKNGNTDIVDSPLGRNKFPDYQLMGIGVDCKTYNISNKNTSVDEIKTGNTGLTLKELVDVIINIFTGQVELFNPNSKNIEKSKFFPYCYFVFCRYRKGRKDKQGNFIENKTPSDISNTVRIEKVNVVPALCALDNSLSTYSLKSGNPYIKISDKNNIPKFLVANTLYQILFDILYKLYYNYGINSLIELSSVEDKIFYQKYQKEKDDEDFESMYKESFSTVSFMNYLYYISGGKLKVPVTGLTKFKNLFNMHKEHNIKNMQDEEIQDKK